MTKHIFEMGNTIQPGEDYRGVKAYGIHHKWNPDQPRERDELYLNQIEVHGNRDLRDHIVVLLQKHEFVPGEKPKVPPRFNKGEVDLLKTALLHFIGEDFPGMGNDYIPEPEDIDHLTRKLQTLREQV